MSRIGSATGGSWLRFEYKFLTRETGEGDREAVEGALQRRCAGSAPSVSPRIRVDPPPPHAAATGEELKEA